MAIVGLDRTENLGRFGVFVSDLDKARVRVRVFGGGEEVEDEQESEEEEEEEEGFGGDRRSSVSLPSVSHG